MSEISFDIKVYFTYFFQEYSLLKKNNISFDWEKMRTIFDEFHKNVMQIEKRFQKYVSCTL
jgi:hypothetical protein